MNRPILLICASLAIGLPFMANAETAEQGKRLWNETFVDTQSGQERSCVTCHTDDLTKAGKHATTGKTIEPMAVSVNPSRLSDAEKVAKWFKRNCKWTLGRECSADEKANVIAYIRAQ